MKKKSKEPKDPRYLSWVKIDPSLSDEHMNHYKKHLGRADFLLYMGEIPNQPGHCVIFNQDDNKMHVGYHIETFIEMTEGEV